MPFLSTTAGWSRTRLLGCVLGLCVWSQSAAALAADPWAGCPAFGDPTAARACAVDAARGGNTGAALDQLEALLAAHPDDHDIRLDLAVIAQWAGNDGRTVDLLALLPKASLPDYALESYARAARNLQLWDLALSSYQHLAQRQPQRFDLQLTQAMVLADAGRFSEAERLLQAAITSDQTGNGTVPIDLHLACGYTNEAARRFTAALACYQRALDADPGHAEARRRHTLAAAALGAAVPAVLQARAHAELFSAEEMLRLELDAVAAELRWSSLPDGEVAAAGVARSHAQQALAAHDGLAAALHDDSTPLARALSFDRIVALVANVRMADAASEFEQLEAGRLPAAELPAYVLAAAGETYLYLQQPKRAATLYEAALQRPAVLTPQQRFNLRVGLFYAYSDQSAFTAAGAVAEELLAGEEPWINPAPGRFLPNARYAQAREITALLLAYRDQHQAALAALDEMLAIAPANAGLRLSRADVLRWRGWPAEAEQELSRVRRQEPDNLRAEGLSAQLALDTRRYPDAHRAVERIAARAPDSRATLNLLQRWTLHNRPELSVRAQAGRSDGNAFSSDDWQIEGYYHSAPLRYRYRAFVHDINRYGRFDEGVGRDHRLGAGIEYRAPRWAARGEIHQGLEQNDRTGATATLHWYSNDRVAVEAQAHVNSSNVPLRATRAGVTGNELQVSTSYRWHEGRRLTAAAGVLDLDDDNVRRQLQLGYHWRVLNGPQHKLLADLRGYASRNSETGRAYFNPRADTQATVALTHEWRVLRSHRRELIQRFGLEAGSYWQQDFGSGNVWTLSLGHDWMLGPRTRLGYGASIGGRVYDGEREQVESVHLSLEQRL